jgi:hypothetical protein
LTTEHSNGEVTTNRTLAAAKAAAVRASKSLDDAQKVYDAALKPAHAKGATSKDVERWNKARIALDQASQQLEAAKAWMLRCEYQIGRQKHWMYRTDKVRGDLMRLYNLGPQYEILVERLVRAVIRAEQADESGYVQDAEEYRATDKDLREAVLSLQRFTESTKAEVIERRAKEYTIRVVEVLESVLKIEAPKAWEKALAKVEEEAVSLS